MRVACCLFKKWGRRNVLLMSFWYFVLMASGYMYYTYTEWQPAVKVYQSIINRHSSKVREPPGQVYLRNRDLSLRWQQAERLRILEGNPEYTLNNVRPGDDAVPPARPTADRPNNQQLLISNVDSLRSSRRNNNVPKESNSASGSDAAANRTRNAASADGTYRHRVTNERRVVEEDDNALAEEEEVEMEDEEDELRYPVTDTVDMTTIHFENATLRPPVPPIVDGYERIESNESLRMRCSQCAVVSSSGHLINKSRGREIDSAQCVFRMNSSPAIGYEDDVGAKTTVRVIGHVNMIVLNTSRELQQELFINQSSRAGKIIIPWLYSADKVDKATNVYYKIAKNFSKTFPNVEMYLLTPEKVKLAEELLRKEANTWLSTGWMTLLFAIDVCDQIDIYGLAEENHCRDHPNDTTPYHYYDPSGKVECKYYQTSEERLNGGHLFITEKAVFARWAHKFNMSFHSPWWNITDLAPNTTALETPFLKKFYEAKRNNRTIVRHRRVIKRVIKRVVVRRKVPVLKKSPKIKS